MGLAGRACGLQGHAGLGRQKVPGEWVEALWEQTAVLDRVAQDTDEDHQVLDTILALAIDFVLPHCLAHPPPSSKTLAGPGRRSCFTSSSQESLAWSSPQVQCH
ncbi:hypothetical protein Y1Q_0009896 [Alligator mississippiensis]|uniref:Uncharacterized protein n=1 Tax=Alligator mississippiensis TaxID=8496 RepID=A0A151MXD1_ALLMI|nr:hypothetical protein Y1Q_0009896 [Alligator mississippiensis]